MPNTGKTSTLILVYDMVVLNGGGVSTKRQVIGNPTQNDFSDIVLRGKQKIAFYTMGDYSNYLAKAILNYALQNCNVLVCSLSTNKPNIRANNALNQFSTTRINKTVAPNKSAELASNTEDGNTVFSLI